MRINVLQSCISSALSPRLAALAAIGVALAFAHPSTLAAQTRPTQESVTFTPAQVKTATNAIDAHVAEHPKAKVAAASAKKTSTAATADAQGARALRAPVPTIKPAGSTKKR